MKNPKFRAIIEEDEYVWLKVTHNGHQWQTIRVDNPENEIPKIIQALNYFMYKRGLSKDSTEG